jgi:hypothetical protein
LLPLLGWAVSRGGIAIFDMVLKDAPIQEIIVTKEIEVAEIMAMGHI